MRRKKLSQSGFTLVEMMVVAGVVSVLAIGFAAYMYQMSKNSNMSQSRASMNQLQINVLNSSSKSDVLLQSEALQLQNLGVVHVSCPHPCWLDPPDSSNCIYDCMVTMNCPSNLPYPCVFTTHH